MHEKTSRQFGWHARSARVSSKPKRKLIFHTEKPQLSYESCVTRDAMIECHTVFNLIIWMDGAEVPND
jgi:hypothetical protein